MFLALLVSFTPQLNIYVYAKILGSKPKEIGYIGIPTLIFFLVSAPMVIKMTSFAQVLLITFMKPQSSKLLITCRFFDDFCSSDK